MWKKLYLKFQERSMDLGDEKNFKVFDMVRKVSYFVLGKLILLAMPLSFVAHGNIIMSLNELLQMSWCWL